MNKERRSAPLARTQLVPIAAFLLVAQLPHWPRLPLWIAALGTVLIALRLMLPHTRRPARWMLPVLAGCAAIGIRAEFGYFIARDPCVAFLYVLVGIKFLEARNSREGSLLVCLGLFLALTQFFYTQTLLAALAILLVVLLFGGALAALREVPRSIAALGAPVVLTARLALQGVPIAALLFILFPRLAGPLWGLPADSTARTGLSDRMAPGSISDLSLSDAVAFRVDFAGAVPAPRDRYWRGPVLAAFDGREWSARPPVPMTISRARVPGPLVHYTVTLEPSNKPWLFALDIPATLPRAAESSDAPLGANDIGWITRDRQLMKRTLLMQAIRYEQTSALRDAFPAQYGDFENDLHLPPNNPRTQAYARELRASVGSDAAYIDAVLSWFRREAFVYTLAPPRLDTDPVDAFLFETRRGFCEHFAGAFVLLMRAAGIPARVVTGYQGGEINPNGDYLIVRQSDAHAWAEVLRNGEWHRFDPTAAVAPSRIQSGLGAALPQDDAVPYLARVELTWLKNLRLQWDAVNYHWQRSVVGFNMRSQRDLWETLGIDGQTAWRPVSLLAIGVGLWVLVLFIALRRERGSRDAVLELWSSACRLLARNGLSRLPSEGPLAYAERVGVRWPELAATMRRIGELYSQLRYGGPTKSRQALVAELTARVRSLRRARGRHALARDARRT